MVPSPVSNPQSSTIDPQNLFRNRCQGLKLQMKFILSGSTPTDGTFQVALSLVSRLLVKECPPFLSWSYSFIYTLDILCPHPLSQISLGIYPILHCIDITLSSTSGIGWMSYYFHYSKSRVFFLTDRELRRQPDDMGRILRLSTQELYLLPYYPLIHRSVLPISRHSYKQLNKCTIPLFLNINQLINKTPQ